MATSDFSLVWLLDFLLLLTIMPALVQNHNWTSVVLYNCCWFLSGKVSCSSSSLKSKFSIITVNDWLSSLGAYLKTKAFGLALAQIRHLIRPGHLLEKILKNSKNNKKSQASKFFRKITKVFTKFLPKLIPKTFLFLSFKLKPSFNWAL